MAKMTVTGLDEFQRKLSKLSDGGVVDAAKKAVYDGAGIIADEIRSNISEIPTVTDLDYIAAYKKRRYLGISGRQKSGLQAGLGIAPMQVLSNSINTKIGFDGYNKIRTKRWPKGQPNNMIARSVEFGTSFAAPAPFVGPAVRKNRAKSQKTMAETFEKEIEKIGG